MSSSDKSSRWRAAGSRQWAGRSDQRRESGPSASPACPESVESRPSTSSGRPEPVEGRIPNPESRGFTLIELTVVLAVIVTLALILTPSIANFINDARTARGRTDVQTIASALVQFYKDNGFFPQWKTAVAGGPGTAANKLDLLVSPGNTPSENPVTLWTTATANATDTLENQLMTNGPGFTLKSGSAQFGWSGPYLSSAIGADAWNNRYMVNIGLADPSAGPVGAGGVTKSGVWVISAGANGTMETPFTQPVTTAALGGDDIGLRIQ